MGPRHFPSPISIGTDICKSARFSKYIPSSSDASLQAYGASLRSPKSEKAHQAYLKIEPTSGLPKPLFALLDRIFTPPEQRQFWETWGRLSPLRKWPDGMAQIDEGQRERITKYLGGRYVCLFSSFSAFFTGGALLRLWLLLLRFPFHHISKAWLPPSHFLTLIMTISFSLLASLLVKILRHELIPRPK